MTSSKGTTTEWARVPPRTAGPTAADATDIYTSSTRTATAAHTAAVAAAHTTAAAAHTTNCPRFRAAALPTRQPTNYTTASITQRKFLPAAGHVATSHRH